MILLDWAGAARYCGLPTSIFRNAVKAGVGPAYVLPTKRKVMFVPGDLDRWISGWERRPQQSEVGGVVQ